MKVNGLKYTRRFNIGNYEHEEVTVDASVNEGEHPTQVLGEMINFVNTKGLGPTVTVMGKMDSTPVGATSDHPVPKAKKETKKEKAPEPVQEELKPEPEPEKEEKPAKKTKASGLTKYDRGLEIHRKLFSELLETNVKDWKNHPEKAMKTSVALIGKDFLDNEGKVIPEFKKQCIELMAQ